MSACADTSSRKCNSASVGDSEIYRTDTLKLYSRAYAISGRQADVRSGSPWYCVMCTDSNCVTDRTQRLIRTLLYCNGTSVL